MYRTYSISHSRKDGFQLRLEEHSRFREVVAEVLDTLLCVPFEHRFGWQFTLCNALHNWAWKAEKNILALPLTDAQAVAISVPGAWDWVFEGEEES